MKLEDFQRLDKAKQAELLAKFEDEAGDEDEAGEDDDEALEKSQAVDAEALAKSIQAELEPLRKSQPAPSEALAKGRKSVEALYERLEKSEGEVDATAFVTEALETMAGAMEQAAASGQNVEVLAKSVSKLAAVAGESARLSKSLDAKVDVLLQALNRPAPAKGARTVAEVATLKKSFGGEVAAAPERLSKSTVIEQLDRRFDRAKTADERSAVAKAMDEAYAGNLRPGLEILEAK